MEKVSPLSGPVSGTGRKTEIFGALCVFVLFFVLLWSRAGEPGPGWDEGADIRAARSVSFWFTGIKEKGFKEGFSAEEIRAGWGSVYKHPPFTRAVHAFFRKFAAGVSRDMWYQSITSYRAGTVFFAALLGAMVFIAGCRAGGLAAGVLSAVFLFCMPRFNHHARLCATDVIAASMFFMAVASGWKARKSSLWAVVLGVVLAAAVLTKETCLLVIPLFVVLVLITRERGWLINIVISLSVFVFFIIVVRALFLAPVPGANFADYLQYLISGRSGEPVYSYYFGKTFANNPPWHYPFVMAGITTPPVVLILSVIGLAAAVMKKSTLKLWLILPAFVVLIFFAMPFIPVFDCERLLLPAMGFFAVAAGVGGGFVVDLLAGKAGRVAGILVAAVACVVVGWTLYSSAPDEEVYFNVFIGGVEGAHEKGLPLDYWGTTVDRGFLDAINEMVPENAVLGGVGYSADCLEYMQYSGLLRKDIKIARTGDIVNVLLVGSRPELQEGQIRQLFLYNPAVVERKKDDVRLSALFILGQ